MRKDVKLAFVVGGILISVLVVYVLVVPAGKPVQPVTLETNPGKNDKAAADNKRAGDKLPGDKLAGDKLTDKSDKNAKPVDKAAEGPATKPVETVAKASDEDKWALVLNHGAVPMMTSAPPAKSASLVPAPKPDPFESAPALIAPASITPEKISAEKITAEKPAEKPSEKPSPEAPARVTVSEPVTPATQPARTHVIQKGESIAKIAEAVYGNQNYWPHIIRANPGIVAEKIRPGMTINLPPESEVKAGRSPEKSADAQPASAKIDPQTQYEVQPGDNLNRIATKLYGNSAKWQAIYEINKEAIGADPAKLKTKSILTLPEPPTVK